MPSVALVRKDAGMSASPADDRVTAGEAPGVVTGPGSALRAAREAAGLSVEQVSETTRIRATLIRDLEADRFASSGGAVYARGHLRALCRAVGTAPEPLVELLDRCTGISPEPVGEPVPVRVARTGALAVPVAAPPERHGPRWTAAAVVAGVILAGAVVTSALAGGERPSEELRLLTAPTPAAVPSAAAPPPPPPPPQPPAPPTAELDVRVSGGESWISVSSPTETVFEGVVRDGFAEVFRHPEQLRLVVGNAAAVQVRCAGTDAGALGPRGAVRKATCGLRGLAPA